MKNTKSVIKLIVSVLFIQIIFLSSSCKNGERGHNEEGEESGKRYTQTEACDVERRGIKLHLQFDKSSSSFVGNMKNVTKRVIKKARVEVHLSNGVELGPTKAVNIIPGKSIRVNLPAKNQSFTWWSTHAETGSSEHGKDEGSESEHGSEEGEGEHR